MILSRWRALIDWKRNVRADCSLQWEAKRPELSWVSRLKQMLLLRQRLIHTDVHCKLEIKLLHWWKANVTVTLPFLVSIFPLITQPHTTWLWTTSEWESLQLLFIWQADNNLTLLHSVQSDQRLQKNKTKQKYNKLHEHAELSTYNCSSWLVVGGGRQLLCRHNWISYYLVWQSFYRISKVVQKSKVIFVTWCRAQRKCSTESVITDNYCLTELQSKTSVTVGENKPSSCCLSTVFTLFSPHRIFLW